MGATFALVVAGEEVCTCEVADGTAADSGVVGLCAHPSVAAETNAKLDSHLFTMHSPQPFMKNTTERLAWVRQDRHQFHVVHTARRPSARSGSCKYQDRESMSVPEPEDSSRIDRAQRSSEVLVMSVPTETTTPRPVRLDV